MKRKELDNRPNMIFFAVFFFSFCPFSYHARMAYVQLVVYVSHCKINVKCIQFERYYIVYNGKNMTTITIFFFNQFLSSRKDPIIDW